MNDIGSKNSRGISLKWIILALVAIVAIGVVFFLNNREKEKAADGEMAKNAAVDNAFVEEIKNTKLSEEDIVNLNAKLWKKGYYKDDFGEDIKTQPYISKSFEEDNPNDYQDFYLDITISDEKGIVFTFEDKAIDASLNFRHCRVTARRGGEDFNIVPDELGHNYLQFLSAESIQTIIGLLDGSETFRLAVVNTDAVDSQTNLVFNIDGKQGVMAALEKAGIIKDNSSEDDYDVTQEDPEILMNRVIEE